MLDMAEHPEGYPLDSDQALLVVCSTQARSHTLSLNLRSGCSIQTSAH